MQFAKLIDDEGRQIARPQAIPGSVSFDATSGEAEAWAEDGKTLLAEMASARVLWISVVGLRMEGHEPVGTEPQSYRLMQWQLIF